MTDSRHLIDFMQLSPEQLRILRVLLRGIGMTVRELLDTFQEYPRDRRIEPERLQTLLDGLVRSAWIIVDREQDVELRYRINLGHAAARVHDVSVLDQLAERPSRQYEPPLKTLTSEVRAVSGAESQDRRTDALTDLIGRRGGKRAVPQSIWDKLEGGGDDKNKDDSRGDSDSLRKPGKDLLSLF